MIVSLQYSSSQDRNLDAQVSDLHCHQWLSTLTNSIWSTSINLCTINFNNFNCVSISCSHTHIIINTQLFLTRDSSIWATSLSSSVSVIWVSSSLPPWAKHYFPENIFPIFVPIQKAKKSSKYAAVSIINISEIVSIFVPAKSSQICGAIHYKYSDIVLVFPTVETMKYATYPS